MNPQVLAGLYFAPPVRSFWHWSGDGQVLSWIDGTTIAFRPEVETVLRRLGTHGLPPFPAVVLLLASCRERWQVAARASLLPLDPFVERFGTRDAGPVPQWLAVVLDALETVTRLRPELRTGADAKALIAEVVFEGARGLGSTEDAAAILQALSDGITPDALIAEPTSESGFHTLLGDLEVLREGLTRLDEAALMLRTRTGLDQLPRPAEIELAASDRARRLLTELREDPELGGLSRLASDLMAAVHVPRPVSSPDQLPLGGVSDISNRGPLDRLLTSELAHDDLTFAVRVAMHEALYLRREVPPRTPPGRRLLLLDAGIRMWGVPRVFGLAVGMALAATSGKQLDVQAWRARADQIEPVDLFHREGLIRHLAALETEPHPGRALDAFVRLAREQDGVTDAMLITHEDCVADAELLRALHAAAETGLFVATVGRNGSFRLSQWSSRGHKCLREARLSLDRLMGKDTAGTPVGMRPLVAADRDPELPVILSTTPFPLLLPHVEEVDRCVWSPRWGTVGLTRDGRILQWSDARQGARQLTDRAARGALLGCGFDGEDVVWFCVGVAVRRRVHLMRVDLRDGACSDCDWAPEAFPPSAAIARNGALVLVYARMLSAYPLEGLGKAVTLALPAGLRWRHGRFFYGCAFGWQTLAFDGTALRLESVPLPGPPSSAWEQALLFDQPGRPGPWYFSTSSDLLNLETQECTTIGVVAGKLPVYPLAVSRDGSRFAFRTQDGRKFLAGTDGRHVQFRGALGRRLEPEQAATMMPPVNLRHKLHSVFVDTDGSLGLMSTKGYGLAIRCAPQSSDLRLWPAHQQPGTRRGHVVFQGPVRPAGSGYTLKLAQWKDGSRAYLDSRGLLHLRSSDRTIPELTLVLADPVAAWSSDGARCGSRVFLAGDRWESDAGAFVQALRHFTARLL